MSQRRDTNLGYGAPMLQRDMSTSQPQFSWRRTRQLPAAMKFLAAISIMVIIVAMVAPSL